MKKIFSWIKSHKLVSIIALIIIIIIGIVFYNKSQHQNGYVTSQASISNIQKTLEVSGYVDAHEKADLHFAVASRLSWVGVKEGDEVRKWQAIATVDTRTLQKQLQADLNNFAKEFNDHDQTLSDYDYYGGSGINEDNRRILENAQYDLNNSVITTEIRDLAIKLSSLVSPIQGIVTRIDEPIAGVTVGPTDIFQIVNPDTLHFTVNIDEVDVALVSEGQLATIVLDSYPDASISGQIQKVDFASSLSGSGSVVFQAKLSLSDNPEIFYRLGMGGDAYIVLEEKEDVLTVPIEAVIVDDQGSYVEVLKDGKVQKTYVEIGLESDDLSQILSGISEGDLVITDRN
jgi:RND family efflux transporter MFP subunit